MNLTEEQRVVRDIENELRKNKLMLHPNNSKGIKETSDSIIYFINNNQIFAAVTATLIADLIKVAYASFLKVFKKSKYYLEDKDKSKIPLRMMNKNDLDKMIVQKKYTNINLVLKPTKEGIYFSLKIKKNAFSRS